MDKKFLCEQDIRIKFITSALHGSGRDLQTQIEEERHLTAGRIIVRGKMVTRGNNMRADYVLFAKPNIPIAIVEAKDNKRAVGDCIQQAITYAKMLRVTTTGITPPASSTRCSTKPSPPPPPSRRLRNDGNRRLF